MRDAPRRAEIEILYDAVSARNPPAIIHTTVLLLYYYAVPGAVRDDLRADNDGITLMMSTCCGGLCWRPCGGGGRVRHSGRAQLAVLLVPRTTTLGATLTTTRVRYEFAAASCTRRDAPYDIRQYPQYSAYARRMYVCMYLYVCIYIAIHAHSLHERGVEAFEPLQERPRVFRNLEILCTPRMCRVMNR